MGKISRTAPVTDAEFAVLELLWWDGEATVRQIAAQLYPPGKGSEQATVQKLLERLEAKQYVKRDRSTFVHIIRATIERDDLIGQQLKAVAAKLTGGSMAPLIMHLVESERLSKADRDRLRRLLDQT